MRLPSIKPMLGWIACLAVVAALSASYAQDPMPVPQPSPAATVKQTVGIAEIKIVYHRPGVKNRKIWGGLVPYGEIWRAGANENTIITFSHAVKVEGKDLPAGTYGLHMIPTEGAWTIIFSKNSTSWGAYFYKESEDALRIPVKPGPAEYHEWLTYEFSDLTDSSAVVSLLWEKLRVPCSIKMNMHEIVLQHARTAYLRGGAGFTWQGFNQAAAYCLANNVDLAEGLEWANRSVALNENFTNLRTKAALLEKLGKTEEAASPREKSLRIATEADLNTLGYQYLNNGKMKEAIEVFEKNVKEHPDSWNAYDSLAEALEKSGDTKGAIKNYEKALSLVQDDVNKKRITATLGRLKGK
jgi:tetratricopeptide (TPR) repeat protein